MRLRCVLVVFAGFLSWHADAAEFGVYEGAGWTGVKAMSQFVAWFGRRPRRVIDFVDFSSWTAMDNSAKWLIPAWKSYKLTLSIPLTAKGTSLTDVAAGQHDTSFVQIAKLLVENGQADAIVRIGWEANGGWYPWAAAPNPQAYIDAFRHVVTVMRVVPGERFRFDWTTAQGWQQIVQPKFYPGDDAVDIIGEDIYAQTWSGALTWQSMQSELNRNYTLDWLPGFSKSHGKSISIAEWGTGERPDGHGLGDSSQFVDYMLKWINAHDVVYSDYWDYAASDYNAQVSDGRHPKAGETLRAMIGRSQ